MRLWKKALGILLAGIFILIFGTTFVYRNIPDNNSNLTHFDTLIVLGTPTGLDGTPSAEQRERTFEAVREYKAGVASHLIFTGGAAHNRFVEAHTMRDLAVAQGVPANDITEEGQAQNTIQNIYYSHQIMEIHHWASAEVISSPSHVPRTSLILAHYTFAWRTHASPWPAGYAAIQKGLRFCLEAEYCLKLKIFGFPRSRFWPQVGSTQGSTT